MSFESDLVWRSECMLDALTILRSEKFEGFQYRAKPEFHLLGWELSHEVSG